MDSYLSKPVCALAWPLESKVAMDGRRGVDISCLEYHWLVSVLSRETQSRDHCYVPESPNAMGHPWRRPMLDLRDTHLDGGTVRDWSWSGRMRSSVEDGKASLEGARGSI